MSTTTVDWSIIDDETVIRNCSLTARAVSRQMVGIMEYEDLLQEAYILCATNAEHVRDYVANEQPGYLNRWLWQRLTNMSDSEFRKFHKYVDGISA